MPKSVLITGCTSGIGKATAELFAAQGWNVAASMLDPSCPSGKTLSALPNVIVPKLDVTDRDAATAAVAATIAEFGSLDVVINNAGYCLHGPAEFSSKAQVLAQLMTNFYGPLALVQAALPHFRAKGSGLVVNVGSIVYKAPFPFMHAYVASKCALDGLTEALNLELVPLGVRTKIVHPGVTETGIRSNIVVSENKDVDEYTKLIENSNAAYPELFDDLKSSAKLVASVLYQAATDGTNRVRYHAGKDSIQLLSERKEKNDQEWEKELLRKFKLTLTE